MCNESFHDVKPSSSLANVTDWILVEQFRSPNERSADFGSIEMHVLLVRYKPTLKEKKVLWHWTGSETDQKRKEKTVKKLLASASH